MAKTTALVVEDAVLLRMATVDELTALGLYVLLVPATKLTEGRTDGVFTHRGP